MGGGDQVPRHPASPSLTLTCSHEAYGMRSRSREKKICGCGVTSRDAEGKSRERRLCQHHTTHMRLGCKTRLAVARYCRPSSPEEFLPKPYTTPPSHSTTEWERPDNAIGDVKEGGGEHAYGHHATPHTDTEARDR